jgi:hypothetical protein
LDGKPEARRALAAAMIAIGRAADPMAAFVDWRGTIDEALDRLGPEFDANKFLASCHAAGRGRAAPPQPQPVLPVEAERALATMLQARFDLADPDFVGIERVTGSQAEGFDFDFMYNGKHDHGFAFEFGGQWVLAPGPIGREELVAVTYAARRHFDIFFGIGLCLRGADDDELSALRQQVRPLYALWPSERDPRGLCDSHPVVLVLHNPADRQRPIYCAYDPMTEKVTPYHQSTLD